MKILVVRSAGHNKGSESILKSTISSLRRFPATDVYLLSLHPQIDSQYCKGKTFGYPVLQCGGLARFRRIFDVVLCFVLAAIYKLLEIDVNSLAKMDRLGLLKLYSQPDVVVFCWSDEISDTYGGITKLTSILKDIVLCTLLKKPTALNATQIGPFKKNSSGKICMFLTKLALGGVSLITVRDPFSAKVLCDLHISKPHIHITADPAFLLQPASLERTRNILNQEGVPEAKPLIGINTSALIYLYSKGADLKEKLQNYLELLRKIADYLVEKWDATVVLVPHVFAPPIYDDRIIGRKILQRARHKNKIKLITEEYEAEELKGIIGQLDLLISTRMHPIIHAISMHTPVVGIDYTFKTTELLKRVDQQEYVCHITTTNYDELKSKIDNAFYNMEKIRKTLKTKSETLKKQAFLNAKLITDLGNQRK